MHTLTLPPHARDCLRIHLDRHDTTLCNELAVTPDTLDAWLSGTLPIPFPVLEHLCQIIELPLHKLGDDFLELDQFIGERNDLLTQLKSRIHNEGLSHVLADHCYEIERYLLAFCVSLPPYPYLLRLVPGERKRLVMSHSSPLMIYKPFYDYGYVKTHQIICINDEILCSACLSDKAEIYAGDEIMLEATEVCFVVSDAPLDDLRTSSSSVTISL